jgi:hypothetical protein
MTMPRRRAQRSPPWSAPSGVEREGIRGRAASKAGTTVTIWVDDAGDVTTRPLDSADVVGRAVTYSVATFIGITVLEAVSCLATGRLLDRGRMRRWELGRAVVEPGR